MKKVKSYSIIRRSDVWHLTQRQARPPEKSELGCNTVCGVWAQMKDGYERGTPTCTECLHAVVEYEKKQLLPFEREERKAEPWKGWPAEKAHFRVGSRRRRRGG